MLFLVGGKMEENKILSLWVLFFWFPKFEKVNTCMLID